MKGDLKDVPTDRTQFTPLHIACTAENYSSIVSFLIEAKANVIAKDSRGQTPLHIASKYGPVNNVISLIDAGACILDQDDAEKTPIHLAKTNQILDIMLSFVCLLYTSDAADE